MFTNRQPPAFATSTSGRCFRSVVHFRRRPWKASWSSPGSLASSCASRSQWVRPSSAIGTCRSPSLDQLHGLNRPSTLGPGATGARVEAAWAAYGVGPSTSTHRGVSNVWITRILEGQDVTAPVDEAQLAYSHRSHSLSSGPTGVRVGGSISPEHRCRDHPRLLPNRAAS